jgi:hypothetical protein
LFGLKNKIPISNLFLQVNQCLSFPYKLS